MTLYLPLPCLLHAGAGLDFVNAVMLNGDLGLAILLFIYTIATAIMLLNGLVGIFGDAFSTGAHKKGAGCMWFACVCVSLCLLVSLSIYLYVCLLSICLLVCPSVCLYVCLYVCMSDLIWLKYLIKFLWLNLTKLLLLPCLACFLCFFSQTLFFNVNVWFVYTSLKCYLCLATSRLKIFSSWWSLWLISRWRKACRRTDCWSSSTTRTSSSSISTRRSKRAKNSPGNQIKFQIN